LVEAASVERQTQVERTEKMRARLLKATLEVVVEEGWGQASTQKICARAGVSRGAQTHHFPTKTDLLLAAISEILRAHQRELDKPVKNRASDEQKLEKLFSLLWDACLDNLFMESWMEAMTAARTDTNLKAAIAPMDKRGIQSIRNLTQQFDEEYSEHRKLAADLIELTIYLLRGMVIQRGAHDSEKQHKRLFNLWKQLIKTKLDS
jgi:AcrR family transcriptional regulator